MAPEFPQDPEFGRFIDGLKTMPDGGVEVELPEDEAEIETVQE
jgi:hypothetical protein